MGKRNGHVWIGLYNGLKESDHGFYPEKILGIPTIWRPGQVRDDSQLVAGSTWDVKRVYRITPDAYKRALDAINAWNRDQTRWTFLTHCADFTEGVARAAGVGPDLPWSLINGGENRPELFGQYLRQHGGELNRAQAPSADPREAEAKRRNEEIIRRETIERSRNSGASVGVSTLAGIWKGPRKCGFEQSMRLSGTNEHLTGVLTGVETVGSFDNCYEAELKNYPITDGSFDGRNLRLTMTAFGRSINTTMPYSDGQLGSGSDVFRRVQ